MFIPWHVSVFYLHKSCKDNYRFIQGPFKHLSWSPYLPLQRQTLCLGPEGFLLPVFAAPRGPPLARPPPGAGLRPRGQQCLTGAAAQRQEWEISGREGGRPWGSAGAPGFLKFKLLPDQYKSRTRHWLLHGFIALKTRLVRDSYINSTLFNISPPACSKWGTTYFKRNAKLKNNLQKSFSSYNDNWTRHTTVGPM